MQPEDILFQSAAMYKNKANSLVEFKDFAVNNKGNKQEDNKSFYRFTNKDGVQIDVPFERALHIKEKHHLTNQQLDVAEKELNKAEYAVLMPDVGEYQGKQVKIKVNTSLGKMGAVLEILPNGRVFLDTAFFDSDAHIDNWAKENHPNAPSKKPVFISGGTISIADIMREIKGNNRGIFDSANPNIYLQEDMTAVDLTDPFADIAKLPADKRAHQVEFALNALIGSAMDTATPPLQIQITADNKVHIKNSNVKLKNGKLKRHQAALTTLEKIVNVAQKTDRKGAVDASHNTSKKTLAHKANVEEYVYFQAPVKIGEDTFWVELATERVKGQDKNLLDLYNVHIKRNPATAHLSTYGQGSSTNRITNNEEFVKAQESGKTNNPSELLQENLFNIRQKPEEITEIHNQKTGEPIPLISYIAGREKENITPVVLNEIVANATTNKKTVRKVLLGGKTPRTLTSKLGKNYLLSTNSVDKMYSSIFEHLSGEDLQPKKEIILHLPEIFPQMDLILSHKDVGGISRDIERFATVVRTQKQDYYVMVVGKNGRVGKLEIATLYDLQSQANKNAPTNIPGEPEHKGLTYSLGDLDKFVKRKIAKYNNNISGKGYGTTELLQENLFNIQQNLFDREQSLFDTQANAEERTDLTQEDSELKEAANGLFTEEELKQDLPPFNPAEKPERIEDFGKKILGARKDMWGKYRAAMTSELPANVREITLSQYFPEPNYEAAIAKGITTEQLAIVKALRDSIPTKPQLFSRAQRWVEGLKAARATANQVLQHPEMVNLFKEKGKTDAIHNRVAFYLEIGYPAFTKAKDYTLRSSDYLMYGGIRFNAPTTIYELERGYKRVAGSQNRAEMVALAQNKPETIPFTQALR